MTYAFPQPTQADLFSEWVTPSHVVWVEQMERAYSGHPADKLLLILEALFEAECWPVQYHTDTPYRCDFTSDAWRIVSVWLRAKARDVGETA